MSHCRDCPDPFRCMHLCYRTAKYCYAQQNAQASQGQLSDNYNQGQTTRGCAHNGDGRCQNYCLPTERCRLEAVRELQTISIRRPQRRDMTASDLGIVDQLLDDKMGMEP